MEVEKKGNIKEEPLTYILFGSTGDLARKKLFPALGALLSNNLIPEHVNVIGCGRREKKIEELLKKQGVKVSEKGQKLLFPRISYMKNKTVDDYKAMNAAIEDYVKKRGGGPDNRVFFFSLPPFAYASTAEMVKKYCYSKTGYTRLILEKPFGRDSDSFKKLAADTGQFFKENELYRIDHYLGKEVVLTLLPLRFSNQIFEPLWNKDHVQSVHIEWKEDLNTMGRGGYFDKYGIIRDIMQNHLLQVLILVAMDKPKSLANDDVAEMKLDLLKAVKTLEMKDTILGQFSAKKYCSYCKETDNPGYLDDETVPNNSKVPTYAMLKLSIDNDRWRGVPFLMSAGKALDERKCEVRIRFKPDKNPIFGADVESNELIIRIQPDQSIYYRVNLKKPGLDVNLLPRVLDLTYSNAFKDASSGDAYERMLLNCALGQQQLFVKTMELVEAWRIFTPLLHEIDEKKPEPILYPFGDSGPKGYRKFANDAGVELKETWQEFFQLHASEHGKLEALFAKHSHEGKLEFDNVKALIADFYDGREPTEKMLKSFLKAFDADKDNTVTWDEFQKGAHKFLPWTATRRASIGTEDIVGFRAGPMAPYWSLA
eukprot:CAMPEP_0185261996 /NCGR_PEP_ID=MMETSP1359-20130426/10256_1 /TAXON_ID=552665 /ORGANISM="Bigelowiella longifila, Strain CCMP242" /LENGTH=596 /DNA_ID=CAMNT_0027848801 /DNA_START=97 /DNA_END=1887 /DNA_ORIENTATION=+